MGCWPLATLACTLATGHRTPRGGSDEGVLMRMYYLYLISYILYLIFKFSRGDFGGHRPESHRAHSVDTERALISSVLVFRGTRRRAFFLSMNKFVKVSSKFLYFIRTFTRCIRVAFGFGIQVMIMIFGCRLSNNNNTSIEQQKRGPSCYLHACLKACGSYSSKPPWRPRERAAFMLLLLFCHTPFPFSLLVYARSKRFSGTTTSFWKRFFRVAATSFVPWAAGSTTLAVATQLLPSS